MKKKKRFVAMLLSLLMVFSLCISATYAEEDTVNAESTDVEIVDENSDAETADAINDDTNDLASDETDVIDDETTKTNVVTSTSDDDSVDTEETTATVSASATATNSLTATNDSSDSDEGIAVAAEEDGDVEYVAMIDGKGYETLQDAIDDATSGDTITILADIEVYDTIIISENKSVVITSESQYTISADSSSSLLTMIEIEEGSSVTLSGNIVIDGSNMVVSTIRYSNTNYYYLYNGVGMIDVAGILTLQDDITIKNYTLGNLAGAINVHGNNAVLNIEGGTITNVNRNYDTLSYGFCAPVRIGNNAKVNMSGGTITNNKLICYVENEDGEVKSWKGYIAYYSSGGIFVSYSGTINMTGGTISNNEAFRGSAIHMYGGTACYISDNASITNNTCGKYGTLTTANGSIERAAGAIYMDNGGRLYMNGGTISNNKGYSGGGVTIGSSWSGSTESKKAVFEMTGGTITENSAYAGGGIYSYSTGVSITAGKITNNTASLGGGIYSEGSTNSYGVVYLKNVVINENTAYLEGGGLWTCPTGESVLYVTDGGAIYNNSATYNADVYNDKVNSSAAGDDVASGSQSPHSLTLDDRILGGGSISYYVDGGLKAYNGIVYTSSQWPYPVVDASIARYGVNTNTEAQLVKASSDYWALKSQAQGIEFAESIATVIITGNTAVYGGGIAANGGVVIGTDTEDLTDVTVSKVWDDNNTGITNPDSVTIYLLNNGYIIDSAELNAENGWTYTFEGLASNDNFKYTVEEEAITGYTSVVSGSVEEGFVIRNTVETINISGTKTWDDADNQDGKRPESITVNLYAGDELIGSQTVTAEDGWKYTFENLPKYSNGEEINYVVTEDAVKDYSTTYDGYDITNSYTPEKTSVTVVKAWEDSNDQDGIRPDEITVVLVKNGEATNQTVTLNADNNWEASFTDLDVYSNGVAIEYTVEEISVEGYTSVVTGSMSEGFVITNTHTPTIPTDPTIPDDTTPTTPSEPEESTPSETTTPTTSTETTPSTSTTETSTNDATTETVETNVKTGDETQVIGLCLLGGLALIGAYYTRKKKYN